MDQAVQTHKPPEHQKKHFNDRSHKPPLPGPAWMGFGIAIGVAIALLVFLAVWAFMPKNVNNNRIVGS